MATLCSQFPNFNLEDKILLEEGSNFRPPIHHVYARGGKRVFKWGNVAKGSKGSMRGDELAGEE